MKRLGVVGYGLLFFILCTSYPARIAQAQIQAEKTFIPQPASREIVLTGYTRPRTEVTLVTEESGRCLSVKADIGEVIAPGGVFAILDPTFIKHELAGNRADQARLTSEVTYFKKQFDRFNKLVSKKVAAMSDLDEDLRDLESASHQLDKLKVEERRLEERLRRSVVHVPPKWSWKVIERYLEPGEWVNQGDKVAELGRFDVLLVPFALTFEELKALQSEKVPQLRLPELDTTVDAAIARISPDFDPETRKIDVDLEIIQGNFAFRGGLRTELTIRVAAAGNALLVPQKSLLKAYEDVFLVRADGERVKVVLLGPAGNDMARVSSIEIKSGDRFLLSPGS
ncbi:efflux RND transporter periplasmic adaptor subunit [Desulfovibrio inopinatus]|uniref:efflux RND transporter periplasmic adaptor subunit n=1 Tax=Desulfovibrio inopinatus TaxID=102109 RepID=UPI000422B3DC|nr:efflux RND transporter periplasmic adaptor subunit [Desulfovibrio inopinatus]